MPERMHPNPRDREQARLWARHLLAQPNFYVLDTETTGITADDRIVQIGMVDRHGTAVMDVLVNPLRAIPPEVSLIHGISDADVRHKPDISEYYIQLSSLIAGQALVVYNLDFDWRMLEQSLAPFPLPNPKSKSCAMKEYARFWGERGQKGGYRWQKLSQAAFQQGIAVQGAHSAIGDVRMTLALIHKMAE
jgi:DNA polymerase-3 subunit epsilon